jgi:chitinase
MKTIFTICRRALLLVVSTVALASPPPAYKVIAYYYGEGASAHGYGVERIPASKLTHLIYAFADIENGVAVWGPHGLDSAARQRLAGLRAIKHRHPHLKTLLSIGGWTGSAHFSDVALTEAARQRFAASAVALMQQQGFDGLDIDWEFPVEGGNEGNVARPQDKQNYTLLLKALRAALDTAGLSGRRHYLLTSATGASARWLRNTEMSQAVQSLDWVNLMSYDFNGGWNTYSGHVAPLYADPDNQHADAGPDMNVAGSIRLYLAAGVPAGKIVLGLPFYGYSWTGCGDANLGQYQDCRGKGGDADGTLAYADIATHYVGERGYVRHWNARSQVPYLFNAETGEFMTFEDPVSIGIKLDFLKSQGLAGAMFWELSNDWDGVLIDEIDKALLRRPR